MAGALRDEQACFVKYGGGSGTGSTLRYDSRGYEALRKGMIQAERQSGATERA